MEVSAHQWAKCYVEEPFHLDWLSAKLGSSELNLGANSSMHKVWVFSLETILVFPFWNSFHFFWTSTLQEI